MADFDPYHKWLGIPPTERPPSHYRLLGLQPLESDPEVIEGAVERQSTYLRSITSGPHVAEAQKLLNEVAQARICLLNEVKKAAYDETLRGKLSTAIVVEAEPTTSTTKTLLLSELPAVTVVPKPKPAAKAAVAEPVTVANDSKGKDANPAAAATPASLNPRVRRQYRTLIIAVLGTVAVGGAIAALATRPMGESEKARQIVVPKPTATARADELDAEVPLLPGMKPQPIPTAGDFAMPTTTATAGASSTAAAREPKTAATGLPPVVGEMPLPSFVDAIKDYVPPTPTATARPLATPKPSATAKPTATVKPAAAKPSATSNAKPSATPTSTSKQ